MEAFIDREGEFQEDLTLELSQPMYDFINRAVKMLAKYEIGLLQGKLVRARGSNKKGETELARMTEEIEVQKKLLQGVMMKGLDSVLFVIDEKGEESEAGVGTATA